MIDPNMARWMLASVSKFVRDRKETVYLLIEQQTNLKEGQQVWYELLLEGPDYQQINRLTERYYLGILVGIAVVTTPADTHSLRRHQGKVQSILTEAPIPVHRFGDGPDDDQSLIGCLYLRDDVARPIDGLVLGKVDEVSSVYRATVEGQFVLELKR